MAVSSSPDTTSSIIDLQKKDCVSRTSHQKKTRQRLHSQNIWGKKNTPQIVDIILVASGMHSVGAILDESACQSPLGFYFRAKSCLSSTKNAHQHHPIFGQFSRRILSVQFVWLLELYRILNERSESRGPFDKIPTPDTHPINSSLLCAQWTKNRPK